MKYLIGNWKANKNSSEVNAWFKTFADLYNREKLDLSNDLRVVVCPPSIFLSEAAKLVSSYNLPLKLGAQDVSPFDNGAWTGEVTARQIKEFTDFVIIGHSERRQNFREDDQILTEKVMRANEAGLQIVYCVQDEKTAIPDGVFIVAYEPVWAIGTGKTDTPENAGRVTSHIKNDKRVRSVIYGGSVAPDNIVSFWKNNFIDGLLPGGSSLSPESFWQMIINAKSVKA